MIRLPRSLDSRIGCVLVRANSVYQLLQPCLPVASGSGSALPSSSRFIRKSEPLNCMLNTEKMHI